MTIDWAQLAVDLHMGTATGTRYAEDALERILGEDTITEAVERIIDMRPGWNTAQSVLVHIRSERATLLAYDAYTVSTGDRARAAVILIKDIAHHQAVDWVEEFLADPNLGTLGIDILDQLIWSHSLDPENERTGALLELAAHHPSLNVREGAARVRALAKQWTDDITST